MSIKRLMQPILTEDQFSTLFKRGFIIFDPKMSKGNKYIFDFKRLLGEVVFETVLGCERCNKYALASLQYSPNDDKELYLCDECMDKEFREAKLPCL